MADRADAGLRLRLHFDLADPAGAALAALPWELVYDTERNDFLARSRREVVRALAEEIDELQALDHSRVELYQRAAEPFVAAISRLDRRELELPGGHRRLIELAEELLPIAPEGPKP